MQRALRLTKIYFRVWFRDYVDFPNPFDGMGLDIGQIRLRGDYLVTLAAAALLVLALYIIIYPTRLGLAMRMIAEDHDIGHLMGVPVGRVLTAAFFLSAAYGRAAGYLLGMTANLAGPYAGSQAVVKGLRRRADPRRVEDTRRCTACCCSASPAAPVGRRPASPTRR